MRNSLFVRRSILPIVLLAASVGAHAQQKAATDGSSDLSDRLKRLEQQIAELNSLIRSVLPPPPSASVAATLQIRGANARGSDSAKIAFIEYSDFECPFCGRHATAAYRDIQSRFVDTGKIRYIFRHLPIEQLHPRAKKAAEAAECAGAQGKFWEYHDRLFSNQKALMPSDLNDHARAVGIAADAFDACLSSGRMVPKIEADLAEARTLGLTGTPVFMLGEIEKDGSVQVIRKIVGSHPFALYEKVLNEMLANSEAR